MFGGDDERNLVTRVNPETGEQQRIRLPNRSSGISLAWSEGYGDLWVANFHFGTLTRVHPSTGAVEIVDSDLYAPGGVAVAGDVVWVGDWDRARVERLAAVGAHTRRTISLGNGDQPGVWAVAVGEGKVWATTPRDGELWRIDATTNQVTRIAMPYPPTGVTTSAGDVWVTVADLPER